MDASPSLRDNARSGRARAGEPPIPTVPGLPLLGNALEFRRDRLGLQRRAARLGPIARVRIGPIPVHVISDAALAHAVLVEQADAFAKSRGLAVFLRPLLGDGLLTAEGELHRRQRKLLAGAFAPRRIAGYAEVMSRESRRAVEGWRDGAVVDAAEEMMKMTLAIAGATLFDADVRGDAEVVGAALTMAMESMVAGLSSPFQVPYAWPLPRHQRMRRAVATLDKVVYRLIEERRAAGDDRGDVLSTLLAARDDEDGTGMTDQQVRDEVMTLFLAGHETTANALAWTLLLLAEHPSARRRVEEEADAVLGGRAATVEDLPRLAYTLAVIEEAMRMYPPAYLIGRQATREVEIGPWRFDRGTTLMISVHTLHRRADYFPEPDAFRPERFTVEAKKARPRGQYLPFGAGPRVCIGNHFALMEAQLALATIAGAVRLDRASEGPIEPEPLVTLRPRGGLPMRITRR